MKRIVSIIGIIAILMSLSVTVFAGDVPEALSYEDDAQVFIGTLKDFKIKNTDLGLKVIDVEVIPIHKIKGELEIGELQKYNSCYFENKTPEKEKEYFVGWLSNNSVYLYEIESYTEEKITLKITDAFSERIQSYLDEGLYELQETKRVNLGRKITFTEFLGTNINLTEKVTFDINGKAYDVDVEKFFELSDDIIVTDVKDAMLKNFWEDGWDENMLYITVTHNRGGEPHDSITKHAFASISRYGEVDTYSLIMSRMPGLDFEMKTEDLSKLYTLLPEEVKKDLLIAESVSADVPEEMPFETSRNYFGWLAGGVAIAIIVIFVIFFKIRRKKSEKI